MTPRIPILHDTKIANLTMKNDLVPPSQIEVRTDPLLPKYKCITKDRIGEPLVVIPNPHNNPQKPYLTVVKPAQVGSRIEVTVFPQIPEKRLCVLTFFRAQWLPSFRPSAVETMDVIEGLLKSGWTHDQIVILSGLKKTTILDYAQLTTSISDELKEAMREGVARYEKKKMLPLATLNEIKYFPKEYQMGVFNLLVACPHRRSQLAITSRIRKHVGIQTHTGRKGATVPENFVLPSQDEVNAMALSIADSDEE